MQITIYNVVKLKPQRLFIVWSSTRVSNELGAGNPQKARIAAYSVMLIAVTETTIVSTTLFASRHVFGYLFSSEKEVVNYVTSMAPLICLSIIIDSMQGVLSGNAFPSTNQNRNYHGPRDKLSLYNPG